MNVSEIPKIDFFKKSGYEIEFEILALEKLFSRNDSLPHSIARPHRLQFYNIIYITAGEGTHMVDFMTYAFSPGSLIFVSQGQVHAFDVRQGTKGHVLLFTDEYLKKNLIHSDIVSYYRLYNYHLHEPVMQPQETKDENFQYIFKEIEREYAYPDNFAKDEILRLLLKGVLLKAERVKRTAIVEQKNTEWFALFGRYKEHLEANYASTRSVKDYAGMLKISPKHLNSVCKSIAGTTAKQCIDNFMVLEIKRALATSNASVQEITYTFGFDEPTNFVKYFKKHTGYSPAQFRNMYMK